MATQTCYCLSLFLIWFRVQKSFEKIRVAHLEKLGKVEQVFPSVTRLQRTHSTSWSLIVVIFSESACMGNLNCSEE